MIVDVTDATFETDVLQRSMTTPVVVDLWAPWCGPCKTLGPIIEKVVGETNGKVVLAKINVDENPQASQAFRVQSIPAVYALSGGQVVDGFMGAQPEDKVREFVSKLTVGLNEAEVAALINAGDEASLRQALTLEPGHRTAAMLLAHLLIEQGRGDEAAAALEGVPSDPEVEAMLELARASALPSDERGRITSRLGELLDQVKADDDARAEFLTLLEELTVGDPAAAADWRKKLSTRLF